MAYCIYVEEDDYRRRYFKPVSKSKLLLQQLRHHRRNLFAISFAAQ